MKNRKTKIIVGLLMMIITTYTIKIDFLPVWSALLWSIGGFIVALNLIKK